MKKYISKQTLQLLEHAASPRSAPCDEILNQEKSTGIPLGGKNASHQRYKTAGKLRKKPCESGLTEHSNFNLVPKKMLKGGTNFTSFRARSWFGGLSLKTHICSHSTCKNTFFLPKNRAGPFFFLFKSCPGKVEVGVSHGQRFIRDLGDPSVTSSSIREVSSQPLKHPAHQRSSYRSVFHSPIGTAPLCREDYQIHWPGSTRRTTML